MKTLNEATTDELFTALMKKVQQENPHCCYFVDRTTLTGFWNLNHYDQSKDDFKIVAKELKQ